MRLKSLDLFSPSREKYFRLLRIETSERPTIEPTVSGITATCRSVLAISRSLVCFKAAVALIPDTHTHHQTKDSSIFKWYGAAVADVSAARC